MKKAFYTIILLLLAVACSNYGEKLEFNEGQLYYTENVSSEDAQKLGEYLVKVGFFDGNPKNAWQPRSDDEDPWVEIDLEEPVNVGAFSISEPWHPWNNESQKFLLQYRKNGEWADIIGGKTNGCGHTQKFNPVTGRYFRLKITGSKGKLPVLNEWTLYREL